MSVDEKVGRALRDLADEVRPEHDPYGRIRARHRRSRRRRTAAVATTVAGALAVAVVVMPEHGSPPPATGFDAQRVWEQRLANTPVRGRLAASDPAYLADVAKLIGEHRQGGVYLTRYAVRETHILYLDDVGPWRIAIVAFALTDPGASAWTQASAVFKAPKGASAAELTRIEALSSYSDGLGPFTHVEFPDAYGAGTAAVVALAPAGCTLESAAWPEVNHWQAEPTGSYLVRDATTARAEWWRVDCGGRVREKTPAPYDTGILAITDQIAGQELRTARGTPDARLAREALEDERGPLGPAMLSGLPRLVWGGRITWPDGEAAGKAGITTVVAAPRVAGGWAGTVSIRYDDQGGSDSGSGTGIGRGFATETNPADPHATVAVRLDDSGTGVLVIAPGNAVGVRAVAGGVTVGEAAVADDAAVLTVADPMTAEFQALDQNGQIVGRTRISQPKATEPIDGWSTL
ncbi:MAG: hypothetical protein HOU81_03830 [Hamadaea sp.]|uniref:hypothetical protein n=1 Tax=Hamadaea sp. TaxID=2024425 RepID=UPI001813B143|nr:hypothetical protein [Hamadaea sp.]NUR69928.1 hypothetical protein [Hamadaea sp.]NUT22532.1 hypothetical protein [Hamadaea sp.]